MRCVTNRDPDTRAFVTKCQCGWYQWLPDEALEDDELEGLAAQEAIMRHLAEHVLDPLGLKLRHQIIEAFGAV